MVEIEFKGAPRRWGVLVVFWLFGTAFWASWFSQSPILASYWVAHFHLSIASAITLLSIVSIVSVFTQLPTGQIIDVWGLKRGIGLAILVALVGFGLRPLAVHNFALMVFFTAIGGAALGGMTGGSGAVVMRLFPRSQHGFALALANSSIVAGQVVGTLGGAILFGAYGVPNVMWGFTVAWMIIAVIWWFWVPSREHEGGLGREVGKHRGFGASLSQVLMAPSAKVLLLAGLFLAGTQVFISGFMPGYFIQTLHVAPPLAGSLAGLLPLGSFLGLMFLPGWAARKGRQKMIGSWCAGLTLAVWVVLAIIGAHSPLQAGLYMFLFGVVEQSAWVIGLTILEHVQASPELSGVAAGFYGTAAGIGSFFIPNGAAMVADRAGAAGGLWTGVATLALGLLFFLLVRHHGGASNTDAASPATA